MNVADWELTKTAVDWRRETAHACYRMGHKFVGVDALLASHGSNLTEVPVISHPRDLDTAWCSICACVRRGELDITYGNDG